QLGAQGLELSLRPSDTAHRVAQLRRTYPEVRGKNTTGQVCQSYEWSLMRRNNCSQPRPVVEPHGKIWMLWTQRLLSDSDSSYVQRFCIVILSVRYKGKEGGRCGHCYYSRLRCGGTNARPNSFQMFLEASFGSHLTLQQHRPVVERCCHRRMIRPVYFLVDRK
ncbi:unnamed protein product, partial [Ectocarpus sp. 8 AP-2014]